MRMCMKARGHGKAGCGLNAVTSADRRCFVRPPSVRRRPLYEQTDPVDASAGAFPRPSHKRLGGSQLARYQRATPAAPFAPLRVESPRVRFGWCKKDGGDC